MASPLRVPRSVRTLGERGLLLPVLVVLGVTVTLVHGALTREEASPSPVALAAAAPVPASAPATTLPSLRPNLDNVPLRYQSEYWLQLGDRARTRLTAIGSPALTGVMVAPGTALTALAAVDGSPPSEPSPLGETLLGFDESLGAALFALPEAVAPAAFELADLQSLRPGTMLTAVSLGRDHRLRVAPGVLVSAPTQLAFEVSLDLQLEFPDDFAGAAIVDLDGRLAGFAVPRGAGRVHVFPAPVLTLLSSHLRNRSLCEAIEVADVPASVREIRDVGGVVVERVRADAFVPEPSIRPGDVLLSWRGHEIERADVFRSEYASTPPGERVPFRVRRGLRLVRGTTLMPDRLCRPVGPPPLTLSALGLRLRWAPADGPGSEPAWLVEEVELESAAARGGLQAGDQLVRLDGQLLRSRESARLLERFDRQLTPSILTLRRGDRYQMLAVCPATGPVE